LPRPGTARDGAGRKAAPYRYWLPGREAELCGDDLVDLPPLEQRAWLTLARAAVLRRQDG
jgi:hypothetical protein